MSEIQPQDIVTLARQMREAIARNDEKALRQIINAYGAMYQRLQDKIDVLTLQIARMEKPTKVAIKKLEAYKLLVNSVNQELAAFQGYAKTVMQQAASDAVKAGIANAKVLTYAGNPAVIAKWNTLNPAAIETLFGYFSEGSALMKRLEELAPSNAQNVANTILDNVALGKNPQTIARLIQNSLGGGLTDALRMARTVQIYSYREANRASYLANSDVVRGWWWMSALDTESCMACVAMHGTFHTLDETLNDHHNGMCTMLPAVIGAGNPLGTTGEEWFKALPEDQQQAYMGKGKFDAWQEGKFSFGDLVSTHKDDVYGDMRGETPLKDLIGNG